VRVSRADPFSSCKVGAYHNVASDSSAARTAVEPALAVDPSTPRHWIGVWQQDRWIDGDGGARGLVAAYTFDAGKTWKESPVPFDRCTAGGLPYNRASDPSMAIGPDGIAYFAGVAFTEVRHARLTNNHLGVSGSYVQFLDKARGKPVEVWKDCRGAGSGGRSVNARALDWRLAAGPLD